MNNTVIQHVNPVDYVKDNVPHYRDNLGRTAFQMGMKPDWSDRASDLRPAYEAQEARIKVAIEQVLPPEPRLLVELEKEKWGRTQFLSGQILRAGLALTVRDGIR